MQTTALLVITIINICLHILGFLLFQYDHHKNKSKTSLSEFMRYICFCQSVLSFSFVPTICNFTEFYEKIEIEKIISYFFFGIKIINSEALFKINSGLNSAFLSVMFLLELFYCIETIILLKNPISDFSMRPYLYFLICLVVSIISFITTTLILKYDYDPSLVQSGYYYEMDFFFLSLEFNGVIYLFFATTGVISIIYIINFLRSKSQFYSEEKKFFGFRHIIYVIINISAWVFPIIEVLIHGIKRDTSTMLFVINIFWLDLWIVRMADLGKFINLFIKNANNEPLVSVVREEDVKDNSQGIILNIDEISNQSKERFMSVEKHKTLLVLKKKKTIEKEKDEENNKEYKSNKTLSSILQSNFLMEYMFYIIHGIINIADISEKHSGIYEINKSSFKEIAKHKFKKETNPHDHTSYTKELLIETKILKEQSKCDDFLFWLKSLNGNIQLVEYGPKIFRNILKMDDLSYSKIEESFNIKSNEKNISSLSLSEGKSGSFFFFTHDKKFIIKTISQRELKTFVNSFLEEYYNFTVENNHTLLVRTYGVYTLCYGLSRVNVILMENVTPISPEKILWKFDLKGSLKGRQTKNINFENRKTTLKDRDFLDLKALKKDFDIHFDSSNVYMILEMFRYDAKLLRRNNLMDYSFFLTVCKNEENLTNDNEIPSNGIKRGYFSSNKKYIYFIAIIDYLTIFDRFKSIEHSVKTILDYKNREKISAVNPISYEDRFKKFILYNVFDVKNLGQYRKRNSTINIKNIYG